MKQCTKCKEWKSLAQFRHEPRNRNGKRSHCKSCDAKQSREYSQRPGAKARKSMYDRRPEVLKRKRDYMREKCKDKEYRQRLNQRHKEYRQRPKIKERLRKYYQEKRKNQQNGSGSEHGLGSLHHLGTFRPKSLSDRDPERTGPPKLMLVA